MKIDIKKLKSIEKTASKERGNFWFFALLLPEESPNKWDLLVSADWIDDNESSAIRYIAGKIVENLSPTEMTNFSKVVPIETKNPELIQLAKEYHVEHDAKEIRHQDFFGIPIDQAYIITAKPRKKSKKEALQTC